MTSSHSFSERKGQQGCWRFAHAEDDERLDPRASYLQRQSCPDHHRHAVVLRATCPMLYRAGKAAQVYQRVHRLGRKQGWDGRIYRSPSKHEAKLQSNQLGHSAVAGKSSRKLQAFVPCQLCRSESADYQTCSEVPAEELEVAALLQVSIHNETQGCIVHLST